MNVGRFLANAAEYDPGRPAFVWGDEVLSYGQADARSDSLACALRRFGLGREDRVGVLMPNCPQLLESMFAIWKAGGCVVPLNARFRGEEIAYHLADSRARAVIFSEEYREVMAAMGNRIPAVERFICVGAPLPGQLAYDELAAAGPGPGLAGADVTGADVTGVTGVTDEGVTDEALAWLFYTSGTTGRPKGAMLTHGVLTFVSVGWVADLTPLGPDDVGLHAAPLSHGAGFHALALTMKGATQVLLRPPRFDPENFCATVQRHRVTNTWLVPTQIKMLQLRGPGEVGPFQPEVDRLRRLADVRRGPQGSAAADRAGLRPTLRPGRDPDDRDLPAARRPPDGGRARGTAGLLRARPLRAGGPRARRGRPRTAPRPGRPDLRARRLRDAGLLGAAGGDGAGPAGRLAAHGRCRLYGRQRLRVHPRPDQGHDHQRRGERIPA